MRAYFGEENWKNQRCLQWQEKNGWVNDNVELPQPLFTLGTEGSGHHPLEWLLGGSHPFPSCKGNGGRRSVPTHWREGEYTTAWGSHPDVFRYVEQNNLIIAVMRYPPSTLLSTVSRFHWKAYKHGENNSKTSSIDEMFALLDGLVQVNLFLQYEKIDCSRLLILPFEIIEQKTLAIFGPLYNALRIDTIEDPAEGIDRFRHKIHDILHVATKHQKRHKLEKRPRYVINETICNALQLHTTKHGIKGKINDVMRQKSAIIEELKDINWNDPVPCADRLYDWAKQYFDKRRFMYSYIYPDQKFIDESAKLFPREGIKFKALNLTNESDDSRIRRYLRVVN